MNSTRIFGIVVIIVGAVLLLFSNYIAEQVGAGKMEIQSGQSKVDTANSLFSTNRYTKGVGDVFTGSSQRRIDEGRAEVAHYESMAHMLQIGGIVLIVIGAGIVLLGGRRRSS